MNFPKIIQSFLINLIITLTIPDPVTIVFMINSPMTMIPLKKQMKLQSMEGSLIEDDS